MDRAIDAEQRDAHETTPFLPSGIETQEHSNKSVSPTRTRCTWPWIYVVALCGALILVADVGQYLFLAPRIRLFESVVCTKHWLREDPSLVRGDGSVPEVFCKVDAIQDKLASILGWQQFFDNIPAILLPIPYGYLADKYGRKWILVSAIFGLFLSWISVLLIVGVLNLPLEFVWLSSLFFLVGGGSSVATALVLTIAADVTPADKRSSIFFYLYTSALVDECLVPPITSVLMAKTPWIPLLGGVAMLGLCTLIALALPESLPVAEPVADGELIFGKHSQKDRTWNDRLVETRKSFAFATSNISVVAIIFTFLVAGIGRQSFSVILQYVSKRYGWSLSKAGLLMSLRAAVSIVQFTVILPLVATLTFFRNDANLKDLWIARASILLLILGSCVLSLSATPAIVIIGTIVYTLGTGFPVVLRSLVTAIVETKSSSETSDVGRLYALIALVEGIGNLIAGPGMAWAFRVGIGLGTNWLGLPFALAAILFMIVSPVVFVIRI